MIYKEDFISTIKNSLSKNRTKKKYNLRKYQIDVAYEAISFLNENKNVVINLPTGTGKTLISNYISVYWNKIRPNSKILYILPTRLLLNQHREAINWCANDLRSFKLYSKNSNNYSTIDSNTKKSQVIIVTPELFYNRRQVISLDVLNSIDLIVVDEFDDFLMFEFGIKSYFAKFSLDFKRILKLFKNSNFLLVSATSPIHKKKGLTKYSIAFSELIRKTFQPELVTADSRSISRHIPKAHVNLVEVVDDDVLSLDEGINTSIRWVKDKVVETISFIPDFTFLLERVSKIDRLPPIYHGVKDELNAIKNLIYKRNFLYDDLFAEITASEDEVYFLNWNFIMTGEGKRKYSNIRNVLVDNRKIENEYHPSPRGKYDKLLSIINDNKNKKGVVFLRFNRLSNMIKSNLEQNNISCLQIDGSLGTSDLEKNIEKFKTDDYQVLLLNRDSGGRGLDIPHADYAIFYSPKLKEDSVWQELSRIRSTVSNTKTTHMLYYSGTNEVEKLTDLVNQMKESDRMYKFTYN